MAQSNSAPDAIALITPIRGTIQGWSLDTVFSGNEATKSITSNVAGNIQVHLIGNPAGVYTTYVFAAGQSRPIMCDEIRSAATTVASPTTNIHAEI